ncbi:MAG: ADP-ribosylglycohydrolase family protein [Thermoguttaceae bacterium]|nr:ADP-ribosylglycohydrolase family protein [Thermoguttaceae bacterium]
MRFVRLFSLGSLLCLALVCSFIFSCLANGQVLGAQPAQPVRIIFDTDLGNDVDDTLALALIHNLQTRGEIELLAVTMTKDNVNAERFVKMINAWYGRPDIPIGYTRSGITKDDGNYVKKVLDLRDEKGKPVFPVEFSTKESSQYMEAVRLLRKTLAGQPDGQTVLVQVGFSTNLAALLDSGPDEFSPLGGRELFARKVKYISTMAGGFPPKYGEHREYNVKLNIPAAKKLFSECPVPVVFSGFEIGLSILMPGKAMQRDYNYVKYHPLKEAYRYYRHGLDKNQATYDLTSVLYAARPSEKYFTLSEPGTVTVLDDGRTVFKPKAGGLHRYMILTQTQRDNILGAFIQLCPERNVSFRKLSVQAWRNRMKAAWLGQIIGVVWGAPTEFKWKDAIIPAGNMPVWKSGMENNAFGQDDLYVEMTFLRTLERCGLDCPIREAGIDFANSRYKLWCANRAGRNNLRSGIAPPDSGHPKFNKCCNDIDYQIESDFAGILSPGMPNSVIELGDRFGRLMNYSDGVYGGIFVGAMYAEAFFTDNVQKVIAAGLKAIPPDSQYAMMVRDVTRWYGENPTDWEKTWRLIQEKYRKNPEFQKCSNGGIDVKINGAYILMGLLYGDKQIESTVVISTRCGQDSDCNPSNAAGVLCTMLGFDAIPEQYRGKLNTHMKFSYTDYDFTSLLQVCEKLVRQNVVYQGGRIGKDASGNEMFVLPVQSVKCPPLELSWAPSAPEGLRFTAEELKRIVERTSDK